jgi:hypothetical protein
MMMMVLMMIMMKIEHVDGKEVGNMIYGFKGMSRDQPQVLAVLVEQWRRLIDDYEGIFS